MGADSKIEWTDHTFNPWVGCAKVSPGCAHCYAETLMDTRHGRVKWGKGQPRSRTSPGNWGQPIRWNKIAGRDAHEFATTGKVTDESGNTVAWHRPRVFCASLADVFDPEVPAAWRRDLFFLITQCHHLDFLLLTKRPELVIQQLKEISTGPEALWDLWSDWECAGGLPNVWLGTSVEDQARADERIPSLVSIPARVRFLSMEPLLGAVDLRRQVRPLSQSGVPLWPSSESMLFGLDWVIIGGESGPGARPFSVDHAADLVQQCETAGVPCFVKQLGAYAVTSNANLHDWPDDVTLEAHGTEAAGARVITRDRKGGDIAEFPEFLQVRQFPVVE